MAGSGHASAFSLHSSEAELCQSVPSNDRPRISQWISSMIFGATCRSNPTRMQSDSSFETVSQRIL
jgi:hypothetical protein